jgi:hypothetical protein
VKKEKFKKLKKEVLKNFDFKSVAKAMQAVNWIYAPIERVPDEEYLRKTADDLLDSAFESRVAATGGFRAKCTKHKLSLKFTFEQYGAYNNDTE